MKASEMPERIYLFDYNDAMVTPLEGDTVYVREDAFIEKAVEYINEHFEYYIRKDKMCNMPFCPIFAKQSFIDEFRKYMKGE